MSTSPTTPRRRLLQALALACGLAAAATAGAQAAWPNKPVRMIVPFPAGGSSDVVARDIALHLSTVFGQQFVVDNRAGAGGNIGADAIAKAAPDGYTIGLATSGPLANNKLLYKNMPFDPQKDFTPVALVGEIPLAIAAYPGLKVNTLKDFVAQAKAQPSKFSAAHPGNGTIGHLALEYFRSSSGAPVQPVAYKGDTPAMTDVLGGQVQAIFVPVTALIPNIQAGKLTALAVTSRQRFPGLPNVGTAVEQGVDLEATVWFAVVGPAGLPQDIVARMNKEINAYTDSAAGRAKLAQFGLVPAKGGPELLGNLVSTETARWKKVVDAAGITLD